MSGLSARGWAYVGAVTGGAVSVAANVAHSYVPPAGFMGAWSPPPGAVVMSVFWPVALLVAVEILARTSWPAGARWIAVRWLGLLPVAVVAAVVSYRHLSGLLAFYGEDPLTAVVGPVAVDGLMVMATGGLLAMSGRRAEKATETDIGDAAPVPVVEPDAALELKPDRPRRRSKTAAGTGEAVAALRADHPELTTGEVAARLGVSARTVRRHTRPATPDTTTAIAATGVKQDMGRDTDTVRPDGAGDTNRDNRDSRDGRDTARAAAA